MAPVISSLTVSESFGYIADPAVGFAVTVSGNYSASVPNVLSNRILSWGDSTSLNKPYSQSDSYPGDIRPGMMRIGFSDSNIGSRWQDPSGDRVGVERLYRQWADSLSVPADANVALTAGRLPWVSFKIDNWAAAAAGGRDAHFDSIIAGLKNLDKPVWISVEPQPEATVAAAIGSTGYTVANWRSFQQKFKARLAASGADKIAFAPVLSMETFNTVVSSWWIDGCWDFVGADFRVQNSFGSIATSPQNYGSYFKARTFVALKNLVLNISNYSSNSFDATAAAIHEDFFENVLGSASDGAGARVASVCYSSAADALTGYNSIPPVGSAVYDALLGLLSLSTSGLLVHRFGVIQDSFSVTKIYYVAGNYQIKLTVTTDDGDAISVVRTVIVQDNGPRPQGRTWAHPPHRPNRATFWRDSIFNTPVDELPVDPDSVAIMTSTGNYQSVYPGNLGSYHMEFKPTTTTQWNQGQQVGYWSDSAPADTPKKNWNSVYSAPTFLNPLPLPGWLGHQKPPLQHIWFTALRQQGAFKNLFTTFYNPIVGGDVGDRHAICWDESRGELFEAIGYGGTDASCEQAVTWDLNSYDLPSLAYPKTGIYGPYSIPYGVCVAEIPIAQFFFTYQDLLDCEEDKDLGHMLGFTLANYKALNGSDAVWPARGADGNLAEGLKAGQIIRLAESFDENTAFPSSQAARAIARTLKKYGAMLFDRGGQPKLIAPNDPTWPADIKQQINNKLLYTHFEVVDISSIEGEPGSHKIATAPLPSENLPPTAVIEATPTSGLSPLTVNFDASSSVAGDGAITSYYWNFSDGFSDINQITSHTYTEGGTYVVALTVTDDEGVFDIASTEIVVTAPVAPNVPPVANIAGPLIGKIGETQNFSSSLSTDSDGSIVSVSWDFGDGTTSASASPSKIYTRASDVPPLPGDTPDGVVRLGATYTGSASSTNAFLRDRYENQAGKSLGIHRLPGYPNEPGVLTPAWNPPDRVTAASVTTAAGRMPWFSYFPPVDRVIAGSEDANILALLTSLKNVDKPIWLSVWDNPEYYVGVADWFTIEQWRLVQVKFRQILNQINATNISFAPIFDSATWEGDQLGANNPDSYLEPLAEWDFYGLIHYVTAASSGSIGDVVVPVAEPPVSVAGTVFMSTTGNDLNAGSLSSPVRSFASAYALCPSGGTITVRGGTYEEGSTGGGIAISKPLTIQAYPGESVWFDGSTVVSSWAGTGPWVKTGWAFNAGNTSGFTTNDKPNVTYYMDQLFINDVSQVQVATTAPNPGEFSVVGGSIYLGSDPTGKTVRVSQYRGLFVVSQKVVLSGIGVRRYASGATSANTDATASQGNEVIYFGGTSNGSTIKNCWFVDNSHIAVSVGKSAFTIKNNTFTRSGKTHIGIGGSTGGDGLVFTGNTLSDNNLGGWPAEPTTAAIKIVRTNGATITDNVISNTFGSYGIWLDLSCTRCVIARNTITGTAGAKTGILFEISGGGLLGGVQYWSYIVDNKVSGPYQFGITLFDSSYVKVWNNTVEGCTDLGFRIIQDSRPIGGVLNVPTLGNYNVGSLDFFVHNIEFVNNKVGTVVNYAQVAAYNMTGTWPPVGDTMFDRFEGNSFIVGAKPVVMWGSPVPPSTLDGRVNYATVDQLDARALFVSRGWKNISGSGVSPIQPPPDVAAWIKTGYPTGLTDFRQWAKTKNISHMAIADYGNNDQTVSGVNELESFYNYCLSSGTDNNGPAIMGLSLGSLYIPPLGSITLTKFNQLAGRQTSWNISQKVQYGPYLVTLTVTDDDGETASKTQSIFISSQPPPNLPPIAIIAVPPTGTAGTPVAFSSAGSSDPDGTISSYLWTFGNGSVSAQANPVYAYPNAGTYTVSLRVTDNDGAPATQTGLITVSPPNLPPVSIISGPTSVLIDQMVTLTSVSTDSDGTIVSYLWDFDDGTASTAESPTKAWTTSGYYAVTLTVRDDDGASDVSSQRVTAISDVTEGEVSVSSEGAVVRPDPYKQIVLGWDEDKIETLSRASYFRAYGYPAPNALVESIEVDFGEIGSGLRNGGFGVSVVFLPSGSVIPGVWSGLGEFGVDYGGIYTVSALWDGIITATFTPTAKVRTDSFAIRITPFQGSVEVPGFRLVSVAPDFSIEPIGSNPFEVGEVIGFTTFPVVTDPDPLEHSYDTVGSYIVSMTSGVDEATTVIEIIDPLVVNEPPVPVIDRVGEPSAGIPYGLIGSNSYDNDGTVTAYSWDFGDGTTSDQADLSKTWSSGGIYRVVLTVYDDEGASASIVESITVSQIVPALGCGGNYQSFAGSNLEAWNGTNIWGFVDWDDDWYPELVANNASYQVAVLDGTAGNASLSAGSGWFESSSVDNVSFYAATQVRFPESAVSGRLRIGASLTLRIDESDYGDIPAKATFALYRSNGDFLDGAKTYKSQVWSERYSFSVLDGTAVSDGQRVDISLDTGTLPLFALDSPLVLVVSIDLLGTENVIPNGLEVSFFNFVGCYLTD